MTGLVSSALKIGTSLVSSSKKKKASKKAQKAFAEAQAKVQAQASANQDAVEARFTPWSETGRTGLNQLAKGFTTADFQVDPGYAFRKEEGLRALDRTLANRGSVFSGAQLRGAQDYGQNIASEEYDRAYDRWSGINRTLASLGFNADSAIGQSLGDESRTLVDSLNATGNNNAASIRERGAISADMWNNIGNEAVSAIESIGSGGGSDILKSLKSAFGSSSSTGTSPITNGGTSTYYLNQLFNKNYA